MAKNSQISALIGKWATRRELANQIGANVDAVHKWAKANRIPADWQSHVVRAAQEKGMTHITADWMIKAHERQVNA